MWGPCCPRQIAPGGGHPCHHRSCQLASHKGMNERGRQHCSMRVGRRLEPASCAPTARGHPDTQLVVEDPPSQDVLGLVHTLSETTRHAFSQGTGAICCRAAQVLQAARHRRGTLLLRLLGPCCRPGLQPRPHVRRVAAALAASRPHLWRDLACPSPLGAAACRGGAVPRAPPTSPSRHRGSMPRRPLRLADPAAQQLQYLGVQTLAGRPLLR